MAVPKFVLIRRNNANESSKPTRFLTRMLRFYSILVWTFLQSVFNRYHWNGATFSSFRFVSTLANAQELDNHRHRIHRNLPKKQTPQADSNIDTLFKVENLIDQALCNNDPDFHPIQTHCFDEHRHHVKCDDRVIEPAACQVVRLNLYSIDEKFSSKRKTTETVSEYQDLLSIQLDGIFHHIFSVLDEKFDTYRRLVVEYPSYYFPVVSHKLDDYLAPRPWLSVNRDDIPQNSSQATSSEPLMIEVDHYHHEYEQYFRYIAAIQYPASKDICLNSPMLFNRYNPVHPGWAAVLSMYFNAVLELPYAISAVYVSRSNTLDEDTGFIQSKTDCPHLRNKWECAFLPTTNCTLPHFITNCTKEGCIADLGDTMYFSTIITSYAENATVIKSKEDPGFADVKKRAQEILSPLVKQLVEKRVQHLPQLKYLPSPNLEHSFPIFGMGAANTLFDNFFIRHNAFYRHRMQQLLEEFYRKYQLSSHSHCVAAHIRRGDRSILGMNMTEYCEKGGHEDYGCRSVPFGSVALISVIKKAEMLADKQNRNLFVATDDPLWLEVEILNLKKQGFFERSSWRVYALPPPVPIQNITELVKDHQKYEDYLRSVRFAGGTASGVYLFGSVKLMQQCSAFVGHLGSGISWTLYRSMCYKHGQGKYIATCPPFYDVRNGL